MGKNLKFYARLRAVEVNPNEGVSDHGGKSLVKMDVQNKNALSPVDLDFDKRTDGFCLLRISTRVRSALDSK